MPYLSLHQHHPARPVLLRYFNLLPRPHTPSKHLHRRVPRISVNERLPYAFPTQSRPQLRHRRGNVHHRVALRLHPDLCPLPATCPGPLPPLKLRRHLPPDIIAVAERFRPVRQHTRLLQPRARPTQQLPDGPPQLHACKSFAPALQPALNANKAGLSAAWTRHPAPSAPHPLASPGLPHRSGCPGSA